MPKKKSKLIKLFEAFWAGQETDGRSYRELNSALDHLMGIAITARIPFELNDWETVYKTYRGTYWFGVPVGEGWYTLAAEYGHISCCQSFEKWKARPAFVFDGKRLGLGSEFKWEQERVRVTSFGEDHRGHFLGCCLYHPNQSKVSKRVKVYLEELRAGERAKAPPKPEPLREQFLKFFSREICYSEHREFIRKHRTLKEAWAAAEGCGFGSIKLILRAIKYDAPWSVVESWKEIEDIRKSVGDFDAVIVPLLKAEIAARKAAAKQKKESNVRENEQAVGGSNRG